MSEKRFSVDNHCNFYDNEYNVFYPIEGSRENIELLCRRLNNLNDENEQLKQREERLLSEIDDFQELLSEKDNICLDKVINVIDDKLAFLYMAKEDINEDIYRLGQISFAMTILSELKKELNDDDD